LIAIRRANGADAPAIAAIHVRCWKHAYRGILPDDLLDELTTEHREPLWRGWLDDAGMHTFVAVEEGAVIGFSAVRSGLISHVYVDPGRQRAGAGRLLLAAAVDAARQEAHDPIVLWVLEQNRDARAFYEANGFLRDGGRKTDPAFLGNDAVEVRYRYVGSSPAEER
jgi:GNAT superfamily N-acetyltransferase